MNDGGIKMMVCMSLDKRLAAGTLPVQRSKVNGNVPVARTLIIDWGEGLAMRMSA